MMINTREVWKQGPRLDGSSIWGGHRYMENELIRKAIGLSEIELSPE